MVTTSAQHGSLAISEMEKQPSQSITSVFAMRTNEIHLKCVLLGQLPDSNQNKRAEHSRLRHALQCQRAAADMITIIGIALHILSQSMAI
jgi:hypothetical protein